MNDAPSITLPPVQLTPAQQSEGERAYLLATKYKSAVADYPAVVAAVGLAVLRAKRASLTKSAR